MAEMPDVKVVLMSRPALEILGTGLESPISLAPPAIAGMARRNANVAALSRRIPVDRPPAMVAPLREIPGRMATAWSEPEPLDVPVESAADLGIEPEPVPSFVAPPPVVDPSATDAVLAEDPQLTATVLNDIFGSAAIASA